MKKHLKKFLALGLLLLVVGLGIQQHETSFNIPASIAFGQDSGCVFQNSSNDTHDRTQHMNGYNVCVSADYMERLLAKRPYPQTKIVDSIERRNLIEKLLRFNDPNKISYLTEMTPMGQVVANYTIQGKVSSNQSGLTSDEQCTGAGANTVCIKSPGDDGSYGENEPGIFFFTQAGVFKQWNGLYSLSDSPETTNVAPIITYNLSDKPTSTVDIHDVR